MTPASLRSAVTRNLAFTSSDLAGDVLLLRALEPRLALDPLEDPPADEASLAEARRHLRDLAQPRAWQRKRHHRVTTGLRTSEAVASRKPIPATS